MNPILTKYIIIQKFEDLENLQSGDLIYFVKIPNRIFKYGVCTNSYFYFIESSPGIDWDSLRSLLKLNYIGQSLAYIYILDKQRNGLWNSKRKFWELVEFNNFIVGNPHEYKRNK